MTSPEPEPHPGRQRQEAIYRAGVFGHRPAVPTNFSELERAARRRMSKQAWAYVAGGAGEGSGMDRNRAALDRWAIVPRMLRDTSRRELSTELFGRRLPAPVLVAPVGAAGLVHKDADVEIGGAAAAVGVPYIFSNQGSAPMEAVAAEMDRVAAGRGADRAPRWFQLYWSTDESVVASFVGRAENMGADALVVTLDTTQLGWRPMDLNIGSLPFSRAVGIAQYTSDSAFMASVRERVAAAKASGQRPEIEVTLGAVKTLLSMARNVPGGFWRNLTSPVPRASVETFLDTYSRPSLCWDDIAALRERTRLPLLLKGILHPDDARRAVDLGVDGILVSNHGGRQIDSVIGAADALVGVADAVDGRARVILDSGVRGGADVFKALALGADAVTIGRPHIYGLAIAGRQGVQQVIENIIAEFDITMGLAGVTSPQELTVDALHR
ncbi:alpha-hydroxyacid dehydrogenase, FMN-dependent L-lactate dehydrogenase [Mycolicibacterium chubuense NBB4]|uniref:Alpha-hydroxyacid dehydrogenase, FMN-dependent L-lactate dehydrogenase n=1 Tax=Mycolicibacterium chubuense (strain NBB4) TaxID=710421 RepID=I4BRK4_MYCCN|nr:alpha-hydroxy-acid oxidizing protein [Mycolicibacterium chubuense]AFM19911.1 alpha-hydroxyacid dehydrogenase, FMN-dependent L-lactate dehydrogenase [Mycolicibacterium chubuense NBB4]